MEWVADDGEEILDTAPVRRRPPGWVMLVVVAVVAVAAVSVGFALNHHDRPPAASPRRPHVATSPGAPTSAPVRRSAHPLAPDVRRTGFRLLGVHAAWELFGRGAGFVVRIQLARGRITTTPVPLLASTGPVSFVVSGSQALVRPLDSVPGYVVTDGKPAHGASGALAAGGPVLPGPMPNSFWAPDRRGRVVLVDGTGRPVVPRRTIRIPGEGFPQPDGSGYVLNETARGSYDERPGHRILITHGSVLGVGPAGWLTASCERGRCRYVVVDAAGSRRSVRIHARPGTLRGSTPGLISPDGSRVALVTSQGVELVDLTTGAVATVMRGVDSQAAADGQLVWSPDSRWLIVVRAGGVFAIRTPHRVVVGRPVAPIVRTLGVRLPPVLQVAVRPAIRQTG